MSKIPNGHPDRLAAVARYYSAKVREFGTTARGVDWNGEASQQLRFQQLCTVFRDDGPFFLNDLGCGYGAMRQFLLDQGLAFRYCGIDLSVEMIAAARKSFLGDSDADFVIGGRCPQPADYSVASGIFNVRLDAPDAEWLSYIVATLDHMDDSSHKGFAFNCLTRYSDSDRMRDYLYYADPCVLFDHCKKRYSRDVALLHDYGLYEFTIVVRKNSASVGARSV